MKTRIGVFVFAVMLFAGLISCTKKDGRGSYGNNESYPENRVHPVPELFSGKVWRITSLEVNGQEYSDLFSKSNFKFNVDGAVFSIMGSDTTPGTWVMRRGEDLNFVLEFPAGTLNSMLAGDYRMSQDNDRIFILSNMARGKDMKRIEFRALQGI